MASHDDRGDRDRREAASFDEEFDSLLHEVDADLRGAESPLQRSPGAPDDDSLSDGASVAADSYWALSRMPLTSLVFILPLVLAYEGGVLFLGRSSQHRRPFVGSDPGRARGRRQERQRGSGHERSRWNRHGRRPTPRMPPTSC